MTPIQAGKEHAMAGFLDRFSKHYDRMQERKKETAEVVDPDAPPIPDAPVEQAKAERTAGRNDPCPCGSGKKYKKCCGKAS
jgi:preprotein translocase subunit SecA